LFIEASLADAETARRVTITGQLGEVMKESAQIALSFLRPHSADLGCHGRAQGPGGTSRAAGGAKDGRVSGITMTPRCVAAVWAPGARRSGDDREVSLTGGCCRSVG